MCAFNASDASLSSRCSLGLKPFAVRRRWSMSYTQMCSDSERLFIGATMIALASYTYNTKMCLLPDKEVTGNLPARSEETTPEVAGNLLISTDMAYAFSVLNGMGTIGGSLVIFVDLQFLRWRVRWPFAVAKDGGKYLLIASVVRPGHVAK